MIPARPLKRKKGGDGRKKRSPARSFIELQKIVARLRGPDGCPWDREQTPVSIRHYLLEEAHELVESIETGEPDHLREELGDLLFQILFLSRMSEEAGHFNAADVMDGISTKLVRRHPHVFSGVHAKDSAAVERNWEKIKEKEKGRARTSIGGEIPRTVPALTRAFRLGERAARNKFDWKDISGIKDKLKEELGELDVELSALSAPVSRLEKERLQRRAEEELGDVLFVLTNLARHAGIDPELALQGCCDRFIARYDCMVAMISKDLRTISELLPAEMENAWEKAKKKTG